MYAYPSPSPSPRRRLAELAAAAALGASLAALWSLDACVRAAQHRDAAHNFIQADQSLALARGEALAQGIRLLLVARRAERAEIVQGTAAAAFRDGYDVVGLPVVALEACV